MTHSSGYDLEGLAKRLLSPFRSCERWLSDVRKPEVTHTLYPSLDYNALAVYIKKY